MFCEGDGFEEGGEGEDSVLFGESMEPNVPAQMTSNIGRVYLTKME